MARGLPRPKGVPVQCFRLLSDIRKCSFLVGSGVSYDSGLPTGWKFNEGLARYLGTSKRTQDLATSLFVTGFSSSVANALRFEHGLQILRDTIDPSLNVLDCFEVSTQPTGLHEFLAQMLVSGARVYTTNFDSLIEAAYLSVGSRAAIGLRQAAYVSLPRTSSKAVFHSPSAGPKSPTLFKLHGTLRDLSFVLGRRGVAHRHVASLGVTLDSIASPRGPWRIEAAKMRDLRKGTDGRTLILLGYSGLDDFDVAPALYECLRSARALIYIYHDSAAKLECFRLTKKRKTRFLPDSLVGVVHDLRIPVWVIRGTTALIAEEIWGVPAHAPAIPAVPVDTLLMRIRPYDDLDSIERARVLATMLEAAGRLDDATSLYRSCVRSLKPTGSRAALWAKCQNNLGDIARQQARYEDAAAYLKPAIKVYKRLAMMPELAGAMSNIGLAYMYRGQHRHARESFDKALDILQPLGEFRRMGRITTNLSIMARREGRHGEALILARRALRLSINARDLHGQAQDWGGIANSLLELGRHAEAASAYEKALRIARKLGDLKTVANQLNNLALCKRQQGDLRTGLALLNESIEINRAMGRRDALVDNLTNRGEQYESVHRYAQAEASYLEAKRIAQAIRHAAGLAVVLEDLGRLRLRRGKRQSGLGLMRRAAKQLEQLGNSKRARELRAEVWRSGGKKP